MADTLLAPGAVLAQRYQIVDLVGRGGMGAVYRARDLRLPTATWAVKEMWAEQLAPEEQEEARTLFEREAHLLAGLTHPALPHVSDYFTESGRQYLVMEFIEGETLEARVERTGPIPVSDAIRWGVQIGDALAYLHERPEPVIFRDVKPGNVMIRPQGNLKIIDFGIARIYASGKSQDTVAFGTPGYAAPEQYGKMQSDARADVYGLGATLHFLLTGRDPSDNTFRFEPPSKFNPAVPAPLDAVIMRAVALDPEHRYATIREMMAALDSQFSAPITARMNVPRPAGAPTAPLSDAFAPTLLSPPKAPPSPVARPVAPGQAPPTQVVTAPAFEIPSLSFGRVRRGESRRMNVRIIGDTDGILISSQRKWLRAEPHKIRGRDPVAQLVVNSGSLREGRSHHAVVTLRTRGGLIQLPVSVDVEPCRLSLAGVLLAALLTAGSLIPAIGLIAACLLAVQYFSCPLDERPALRPFAMAASFFALCNAAFVTIAVFALRSMPGWLQWLESMWR